MPRQVIVEVTWMCPCRCPDCPLAGMRRNETMDLGVFERVLEAFRRAGFEACVISGGEPSVLGGRLRDYVRAAKDLGFRTTVVTCAFDPGAVLRARPDAAEISIDYDDERHDRRRGIPGLRERALWLARAARAVGIFPVIRVTYYGDNEGAVVSLRRRLPWVPILVMPRRPGPDIPPEVRRRLAAMPGVYVSDACPAGIRSLVVTPELDILACIFYRARLGRLRRITREEIEDAIKRGRGLPRFPCRRAAA